MKNRCQSTHAPTRYSYLDRGITVCERWHKFEAFLEDMGMPLESQSIERIDNDGNYCPENCRWATPKEQGRNKSNNRYVMINGQKRLLREVCENLNANYTQVIKRLNRGMGIVDALITPRMKTGPKKKTT